MTLRYRLLHVELPDGPAIFLHADKKPCYHRIDFDAEPGRPWLKCLMTEPWEEQQLSEVGVRVPAFLARRYIGDALLREILAAMERDAERWLAEPENAALKEWLRRCDCA